MKIGHGTVKKYSREYHRTLKTGEKKKYTTEQIQITVPKNEDIYSNKEEVLIIPQSEIDAFNNLEEELHAIKVANYLYIMEVEKLISYLFLTFILLIACFNVIGSLSMLIIDKRADVVTLRNLGVNDETIKQIFLLEGCLISFLGALIGVVLGVALCLVQQEFGLISLGSGDSAGAFVVDAYPVNVQLTDVLLVLLTVLVISFFSVQYPVRYLSRRLLGK